MQVPVINAFEFAYTNKRCSGELPICDAPRLFQELLAVDITHPLHWSLEGHIHQASQYPALTLTLTGDVKLTCQRCLKPMSLHLDTASILILVANEEEAETIEAKLSDPDAEVVVGSTTCQVVALIEDEALLALPSAPKHMPHCPNPIKQTGDTKKESAFAILKAHFK